ncbi:hypothetical protein ABW19_dt0204480 [Dactylella cylindrospora]|nr:hypothetical protein ABW19_dt0204480 [Dactylella cylindrospora]
MAMESDLLSRFPVDIFYIICDYLLDRDILTTQLVSKTVKHKLPPSRIERIHSVKTYYPLHGSFVKLERLSKAPTLARRVTHLVFDLGLPFITLQKLKDELESRPWKHTSVEEGLFQPENPRDAVWSRYCVLWERRKITFPLTSESEPVNFYNMAKLCHALWEFPNLTTIEFTRSRFIIDDKNRNTMEAESYIRQWKIYNSSLADLFEEDQDDVLRWVEPSLQFSLDKVFPDVIFAAVGSWCAISRIKLSKELLSPSSRGVRISELYRGKPADAEGWNTCYARSFERLERLDLHISGAEFDRGIPKTPPSPVFTGLISNVTELHLSFEALDYSNSNGQHGLRFDWDLKLPRLRKLSVGDATLDFVLLAIFIHNNQESLREFEATANAFGKEIIAKRNWLDFLDGVRNRFRFEKFEVEIPIVEKPVQDAGGSRLERVVLQLRVAGDWKDDEEGKFQIKRVLILSDFERSEGSYSRGLQWRDFKKAFLDFS